MSYRPGSLAAQLLAWFQEYPLDEFCYLEAAKVFGVSPARASRVMRSMWRDDKLIIVRMLKTGGLMRPLYAIRNEARKRVA